MADWSNAGTIWTNAYRSRPLQTGQTTQYSSELDDGYYEKGLAKSYTTLTAGAYSGTTNVDLTHLVSDSGAFTAADQTYTDAGKCGVFKAAGGETIVISGSASNNGVFTTVSATADTVVVTAGFVNEADAPETTFKKREAKSNNVVLDNNTGLTWARYVSDKMGPVGTGLMPWTGVDYDIFAYAAACNAASVGGYSDWRVANINEYLSLWTHEAPSNFPDSTAFPSWPEAQSWTCTTRASFTNSKVSIYPNTGDFVTSNATSVACGVYLVRGGA